MDNIVSLNPRLCPVSVRVSCFIKRNQRYIARAEKAEHQMSPAHLQRVGSVVGSAFLLYCAASACDGIRI